MSTIETLAARRRELLERAAAAFTSHSLVAEGLVDASNRLVEAMAYLPATTDRELVIHAALLVHLLEEHGGAEEPHSVPWHALARSMLKHVSERAGIPGDEVASWFPDQRLKAGSTSVSVTLPATAAGAVSPQ